MNLIKQIAQLLWKVIRSTTQSLAKLVQWWINKIKTSSSRKAGIAWFFGGLISICFLCSFLFSITPAGRESVSQSQATRTAMAVVEVTSQIETRNTPTYTPLPTIISTPTEATNPTNRSKSVEVLSPTPKSSSPTPTVVSTPTPVPALPLIIVKGARVNIRSGPGTNYPVIQTLDQNDTAPATGFNSGQTWVQIELRDGTPGWISADLVDIDNSDEIATITDIPPAPPPTASSGSITSVPLPTVSSGPITPGFNGDTVDPPWWPCEQGQIKGNYNSMKYHVPSGQFYAKTYENVTCFNTSAEAEAAGYVRSKR